MVNKKEILFISGESRPDHNLQCDKEYGLLQNRINVSDFKDAYYITFLPNSIISNIDKYLQTQPSIIHYCGHGTESGTLVSKDSVKEKILWSSEHLKETLERNTKLDFLILCSCHSDNIIKDLGFPANYMIGFKGSIEYPLAKKFNELFYDLFFKYGSALHAYLETVFILNRDQVRGIKPVCRSKINYVMKAVLDHQEALLLKNADLTEFKEAIDFAQKTRDRIDHEILITEGRVTGILYELLAENPFAQEIIYLIDNKQLISDQVAEMVIFSPMKIDDREQLAFELFLILEIVEKILGSLRQMKYPKKEFKKICTSFSQEKYHDALSRLICYKFQIKTKPEFVLMWTQVLEDVKSYI